MNVFVGLCRCVHCVWPSVVNGAGCSVGTHSCGRGGGRSAGIDSEVHTDETTPPCQWYVMWCDVNVSQCVTMHVVWLGYYCCPGGGGGGGGGRT